MLGWCDEEDSGIYIEMETWSRSWFPLGQKYGPAVINSVINLVIHEDSGIYMYTKP